MRPVSVAAGAVAVVLGAGVLLAAKPTTAPDADETISREATVLTTTFRLEMRGVTGPQADAAEKAAIAEIERLAKVLSTFDETSEIRQMQLSVNKPFVCSADLYAVMRECDQWRRKTDGAFNPDVGDMAELWQAAGKTGKAPEAAALTAAASRARQPLWRMDASARTIEPLRKLNLRVGSLGKAYIINKAMTAARKAAPGATGMLLAIGGDMTFWTVDGGASKGWEIDVADPRTPADNAPPMGTLTLANGAVTSSGGYARFVEVEGRKHSHIIDPKTGQSADNVLGTTVVAKDVMLANAMSTTLCVLDPAKGLALAGENGVQCQIVDGGGKVHRTSNWPGVDAGAPTTPEQKPDAKKGLFAGGVGWPGGSGLTAKVTVKGGGKRPYGAVWISDSAGKPVKVLALWGRKSKYFKELKRWSKLDADFRAGASAVTSASRQAGVYTLTWNGLDTADKPVKPGTYTVNVELVREKSGPTDLAVKVDCGKTAQAARMDGAIGSCDAKFVPAK